MAIQRLRIGSQVASKGAWERFAGMSGTDVPTAAWVEDARATRTANALADTWVKSLHEAQQAGVTSDQASRLASKAIAPSIDRTATTETIQAFNAETIRQNSYAHALGYRVEETWLAMLDACPRCRDLDGTTVIRPDRFDSDPPLHPRCMCFVDSSIFSYDADAA